MRDMIYQNHETTKDRWKLCRTTEGNKLNETLKLKKERKKERKKEEERTKYKVNRKQKQTCQESQRRHRTTTVLTFWVPY